MQNGALNQERTESSLEAALPSFFERHAGMLFACGCLLLLLLGGALLATTLPFADEGFYGVPAFFLATQHMLKNPVMESAGVPVMTGIHQILYWMVPLGMVIQSAAFQLFGFSLFVQRALSLAAALGALVLWYRVVSQLLRKSIAAWACLFLSVDVLFTSLASRGRADMLALFFALAALAGYLHWRERNLLPALLVANTCCAVSGLIHPNVGLTGLFSFVVVALYLDRSRIRVKEILTAVLPYLVIGAGWALWIAQNPTYFEDQFLGNTRNRLPHGFAQAIAGEAGRYLSACGVNAATRAGQLRMVIPISFAIAIAGCVAIRKRYPGLNLFLLLAVFQAAALFVFEGSKQGWYLLSSMPVLDTLLAAWVVYLWSLRKPLPRLLFAYHLLVALLVAAGLLAVASKRHLQQEYTPAVAFLNAHAAPGDRIFGRSELFYRLNCRACLTDDEHLGAKSGATAEFIVMDGDYSENIAGFAHSDPRSFAYIQHLLATDYAIAYDAPGYRIYRRKHDAL